jgi:YtkA-like
MHSSFSLSPPSTSRPFHRLRSALLGIALLLLTATGCAMGGATDVPDDLDLARSRLSDSGLYRATIVPAIDPIPVNQLHAWTLHVETAGGQPVTAATIAVEGDMPQHGHGMPTRPEVTEELGNGDYRVEGMRFQMGGWWLIEFTIDAGDGQDTVSFNLML